MAVTKVERLTEGEDSTQTGTGWTDTIVWLVTVDDVEDTSREAAAASAGGTSIPSIGDEHPADSNSKATSIKPARYKDRLHWKVSVDYKTSNVHGSMSGHSGDQAENPLNDPVEVNWDTEFVTEPITRALDSTGSTVVPVLNSALDPFDPPAEEEMAYPVVTIVRNEASFPTFGADYVNTINSAATTIAGLPVKKWQAKIRQLTPSRAERNGVRYWQVTYRILFKLKDLLGNDDDWTRHFLDQGCNHWLAGVGVGQKIRIKGDDGKEVREPQRLDGSGTVLPSNTAQEDSVWRDFITNRIRSFTPLNLDFNP